MLTLHRAIVALLLSAPAVLSSALNLDEKLPTRFCSQTIEIRDVASPQKVEILPLYKDFKWAISTRWDDNCTDADLTMGRLLKKYGYKGTFFVMTTGLGAEAEKELLRDGHAIQSHSVTHPGLTGCSYNKIFEELLKSRMDIESRTNTPVNVFAFPGNAFEDPDRPTVQWEIYRLIQRSGYVQIAWSNLRPAALMGIGGDYELPGDGHPLEPYFDQALANEEVRKNEPHLAFCTHAWAYESYKKWPLLEEQLKRYSGKKDCWYCTQAEYGAYRFQWRRATAQMTPGAGDHVSIQLKRPSVLDTGAAVPLSLKVTGQVSTQVQILVDGKAIVPDRNKDGVLIFSVPYPAQEQLPRTIDAVYVKADPLTSAKFPQLQALLGLTGADKRLNLKLKNTGSPMRNVTVTYRLPFAAEPGIARRTFTAIAGGETLEDSITLSWPERSVRLLQGDSMFVAQVDFSQDRNQGRLFVVTTKRIIPIDNVRNYPKGNFAFLASTGESDSANADLVNKVVTDPLVTFVVDDGRKLHWQAPPDDAGCYDLDLVSAGGSPLVMSLVNAPARIEARMICRGSRAVWINGNRVTSSDRVTLEKGANPLIALTDGGLFLQFVSPQTGKRVEGITFQLPQTKKDREVKVKAVCPYRLFIKDWLICGPFPNPGARPVKQGFDIDYLAQAGGEEKAVPRKNGEIRWQNKLFRWIAYHSPTPKVDLFEFPAIKSLTDQNDILVYAACNIISDKDRDILIGLGSDDGYKLYLNQKLLKTTRAFRGSAVDQEIIPTQLKKGVNTILLKIDQDFGQYDFYVTLTSPDFSELSDVKIVLPE